MTLQVVADNQRVTPVAVDIATSLSELDLIPRLAAAYRLKTLPEKEARALAVRHQLVTQYTSMVVVAERADGEKALDLPQTVPVAHMLAAEWGGTALAMPAPCVVMGDSISACELYEPLFSRTSARPVPTLSDLDMPAFLRRRPEYDSIAIDDAERKRLVEALARALIAGDKLPTRFDELEKAFGVSPGVIAALRKFVALGAGTEEQVVAVFLAQLTEKHLDEGGTPYPGLDAAFVAPVKGSRKFRSLRRAMETESLL
jgi:DNA-binding NarL/FixJ family response regulator